jgi:hypothetical protein
MDTIKNRARKQFPAVLLTLLSIVQAIALESLWNKLVSHPDLFAPTLQALQIWLQFAISLGVIILLWLSYVGLTIRFRWTPAFSDSVLPFLIGLIEFLLIELIEPGKLGLWMLTLALVAALSILIDFRFMRRARLDPDNGEFFDAVLPATWRDFVPQVLVVVYALSAGLWLVFDETHFWFSLLTLLVVLAAILHNALLQASYWRKTIG